MMETPGFSGFGDLISKYGIKIKRASRDMMIVIFTELPHDRGMSIADIIEHLATEIYRTYLAEIPLWNLIWILYHPPERIGAMVSEEAYDQVVLQWDGHHFRSPKWIALPRESWELYGLIKG